VQILPSVEQRSNNSNVRTSRSGHWLEEDGPLAFGPWPLEHRIDSKGASPLFSSDALAARLLWQRGAGVVNELRQIVAAGNEVLVIDAAAGSAGHANDAEIS
jgi:hypothetical protein